MDVGEHVTTRKQRGNFPYVSLHSGYYLHAQHFSKYQGLFLRREGSLFKYVDGVRLDADIHHVQRGQDQVVLNTEKARVTLHRTDKGLRITATNPVNAVFVFDTRFIDDYDDQGRIYNVDHDDTTVRVNYRKYCSGALETVAYDASFSIQTDTWAAIDDWQPVAHSYDERRGDTSNNWVYRAGEVELSPDNPVSIHVSKTAKNEPTPMSEFLYEDEGDKRVAAGYPWFYEAWSRDEIISLHPIITSQPRLAKSMLVRAVTTNQGTRSVAGSDLSSADTPGWIAKRLSQLIEQDDIELTDDEAEAVIEYFETYLSTQVFDDRLVVNDDLETWMDTAGGTEDTRRGKRVEIQAGLLTILTVLDDLSDEDYHRRYVKTKQHIQRCLVDDGVLHDGHVDGHVDRTRRPNVFLAYYLHDDMVKDAVWRRTFDRVIDGCWLKWGGFSSIAQDHRLFHGQHTGVDNRSYHRGDSWYYVNNIAALALHDLNASQYLRYIEKIRSASLNDYRSELAVGACSEISDAETQRSAGCVSQAWSYATLLELLEAV